MAKKKAKKDRFWMQEAFSKNKGALHRQTGTPEGETIPASKLEIKESDTLKTKRRKNLAKIARKIAARRRGK